MGTEGCGEMAFGSLERSGGRSLKACTKIYLAEKNQRLQKPLGHISCGIGWAMGYLVASASCHLEPTRGSGLYLCDRPSPESTTLKTAAENNNRSFLTSQPGGQEVLPPAA